MRSFACAALVSVAAAATAFACLPDPKGDFDDFKSRTAGMGESEAGTNLDASIDTKPPEVATESLYVGICVTALASKDPEEALRFYTKTKFVPDPAGGGKLSMEVTPLLGWDNGGYVTPMNVSQGQTRGSPLTKDDITVAAGAGRFTANLGVLNLPGAANSISGRDAVINDATLDGRFGDPEFCSTLGGHLTVPYEYDFVPSENTCLFIKVKEGDPVPVKKAADFVCPL